MEGPSKDRGKVQRPDVPRNIDLGRNRRIIADGPLPQFTLTNRPSERLDVSIKFSPVLAAARRKAQLGPTAGRSGPGKNRRQRSLRERFRGIFAKPRHSCRGSATATSPRARGEKAKTRRNARAGVPRRARATEGALSSAGMIIPPRAPSASLTAGRVLMPSRDKIRFLSPGNAPPASVTPATIDSCTFLFRPFGIPIKIPRLRPLIPPDFNSKRVFILAASRVRASESRGHGSTNALARTF